MRHGIVEELAKAQRVERIIDNICRPCADTASLADLAQMVYLILLTYDRQRWWTCGRKGKWISLSCG